MNNLIEDIKYNVPFENSLINDPQVNQISQFKIVGLLDKKQEIFDKLNDISGKCDEFINIINIDYQNIFSQFIQLEDNIDLLNTTVINDYNNINTNILTKLRKSNDYMRGFLTFDNNKGIKSNNSFFNIGNSNTNHISIGDFNFSDPNSNYSINIHNDNNLNNQTIINIGNDNDEIFIHSNNNNISTDDIYFNNNIILNKNNILDNNTLGVGLRINYNDNTFGQIVIGSNLDNFIFKLPNNTSFRLITQPIDSYDIITNKYFLDRIINFKTDMINNLHDFRSNIFNRNNQIRQNIVLNTDFMNLTFTNITNNINNFNDQYNLNYTFLSNALLYDYNNLNTNINNFNNNSITTYNNINNLIISYNNELNDNNLTLLTLIDVNKINKNLEITNFNTLRYNDWSSLNNSLTTFITNLSNEYQYNSNNITNLYDQYKSTIDNIFFNKTTYYHNKNILFDNIKDDLEPYYLDIYNKIENTCWNKENFVYDFEYLAFKTSYILELNNLNQNIDNYNISKNNTFDEINTNVITTINQKESILDTFYNNSNNDLDDIDNTINNFNNTLDTNNNIYITNINNDITSYNNQLNTIISNHNTFKTNTLDSINTINSLLIDKTKTNTNIDNIIFGSTYGIDTDNGILNIGNNSSIINIGSTNNNSIINIGNDNSIIKFNGTVNTINMNNINFTKPLINIGYDSFNNNDGYGFNIRDNNTNDKGFIKTNSSNDGFLFKAPQSNNTYFLDDNFNNDNSIVIKSISDSYNNDLDIKYQNILNTYNQSIDFNKINNYTSNSSNILLGDGTFGKITNNFINDNTLNVNKLNIIGNGDKVLFDDGTFKPILFTNIMNNLSINNTLNVQNYKIINVNDPINNTDLMNLKSFYNILDNIDSYLTTNSINLNKLYFDGLGNKILFDDGSFRSLNITSDTSNLINISGNIYKYVGSNVNHINDIPIDIFYNVPDKFFLIYNLKTINGVIKIKASCLKSYIDNTISQSIFSINFWIDNTPSNFNVNNNLGPNDTIFLNYDNNTIIGLSQITDYTQTSNYISININNDIISSSNLLSLSLKTGYQTKYDPEQFIIIPLIGTGFNIFLSKNYYYIANNSINYDIKPLPFDIITYLSSNNKLSSYIIIITDSINSIFILNKNIMSYGYYIGFDLTTFDILFYRYYPFYSYDFSIIYDSTNNTSLNGNILFSIDGAISYCKSINGKTYFNYGSNKPYFKTSKTTYSQLLSNYQTKCSLDIISVIDNSLNNIYLMDYKHNDNGIWNTSINNNITLLKTSIYNINVNLTNDSIINTNSLYSFTTFTFTNANNTGRYGPILSQIQSAYSSTSWTQNISYLNMTTQGYQKWTVPRTGNYRIRVAGAGAADSNNFGSRGIIIEDTFNLTQNQIIIILIGQMSQRAFNNSAYACGGGGGSFVVDNSNYPIIIAGGGGGYHTILASINTNTDAVSTRYTLNYNNTYGNNGNGGAASTSDWGAGGGGLLTDGQDGTLANSRGRSFLNGGIGGYAVEYTPPAYGGFGGGGGTHGNNGGGGGGGGYSGGSCFGSIGFGGASYSANTTTPSVIGYNTSHGYVTITLL